MPDIINATVVSADLMECSMLNVRAVSQHIAVSTFVLRTLQLGLLLPVTCFNDRHLISLKVKQALVSIKNVLLVIWYDSKHHKGIIGSVKRVQNTKN